MGILKKATRLSYFVLILLLTLMFIPLACKKKQSPSAQDETAVDKIPLRILYVGLPHTERQADFVSFLSRNFKEVKTVDLYAFKEEQTKDSDVVILDKDGIQWGSDGGRPLRDLQISAQYSRPTLSLGIPGAFWTDRMRLKTGYM